MALDDVLRSGIATINKVTKSLQVNVQHRAWVKAKGDGEDKLDPPILRPAIVEYKRRMVRTATGDVVQQNASILFVELIEPNGAPGRREPIDPRDEITLPDGHCGPILMVVGPPTDPDTSRPYMLEVSLG
jgi:hypothetical protein